MTLKFLLTHQVQFSRRIEAEMSKISDAIKEAVTAISALSTQVATLTAENSTLTAANATLTKKVSDLETLLNEDGATADDLSELQAAVDSAKKVVNPAPAPQ